MIVSVIVPCRNEARHIDAFLDTVVRQRCSGFALEIVVADGLSDDGTAQKLDAWAAREPRLRVVRNPQRIVSTGLNLAIAAASGEWIVRLDVHTLYADDYVEQCLRALQRTHATCVGGPWIASGHTSRQQAISAAFQSRLAAGGAASRNVLYEGPVDTVYLGAWRRSDLLRLGGFDESFVRNQDDELNLRIVRSGGTVWQTPAIRSTYEPRESFSRLFAQFHQYGYWKVAVIRKHRLPASPRHLAPFALVTITALLALLAPWWATGATTLLGLALLYGSTLLGAAVGAARPRLPWSSVPAVVLAIACMHFGYGTGFARGVWDWLLRGQWRQSMAHLTR